MEQHSMPKPLKAAAIADGQLTGAETFWWVMMNIFGLGLPYFKKIIAKKAMCEALIMHERALGRTR